MRMSTTYEGQYSELVEYLGSHCAELREQVCLHWPMAEPTSQRPVHGDRAGTQRLDDR